MSRPTISLALIAKNEEENIERLFKSIEGCFDEVVLVDTGSTDKTVELAEKLGARVEHFTWINDFAAARNYSFSKCTSDYIMWLDLDDVLEDANKFKLWRDTVMVLADYWIATYHYASDDKGNPTCSFVRERVIKRDKGLKWDYFVHEGIIPKSADGPVRTNFTANWVVKHCRTDLDLQKDRSRNLNIFENNKTKLDTRMRYYYGKELFEAQKPIEAIEQLGIALSQMDLEMHDRLLAYQYICYAYLQVNRPEKALELANAGTMLDPNRAELWVIIGDSYLKMGNPIAAVPAYNAAKACVRTQGPTPIFHSESNYTTWPRNQLARIQYHIGNFDASMKESKEAYEVYKDQEAKGLFDEVQKQKEIITGYNTASNYCDDIVISTLPQSPYLWDADIAKEKAMGGSETAAIEMAKNLHTLTGRPVKIFNSRLPFGGVDKTIDGVEYIDNSKVHEYFAKNVPWVHIAWRHNNKLTNAPTYLWCHDLVTMGAENVANYDKIFCLTPFHKRFVQVMQNLPEDKIHVTRNGILPERFTQINMAEKDPNMFVFSSSPDRGLDRTMRVLDKVREKYPDIKLHVFYGIEHLEKYGLKELQDKLKTMMDERKDWVIYHGATQQEKLMEYFKKAAYCVQPSDFIETSMISAMERLLCGVYQVIRKVGGVVDTLAQAEASGMATLVDSECITELEYQKYIDATIKAIDEEAYKRISVSPESFSWESVAKEWVEFFESRHPKKEVFEVFKRLG